MKRRAILSPVTNRVRRSPRGRTGALNTLVRIGAALALALTIASARELVLAADQIIGGTNINVVGGPACTKATDSNCPFQIYGDATVQRQNEGSIACSSRNPRTCLAAGNDYRLIGVPAGPDGKVTADAWLGLYWTRTAGATWRSTLLPGWTTSDTSFSDDTSSGLSTPIRGFQAAADATVRAGTHGLFYISGIAFNRDDESGGASAQQSGGEGKSGVQFVSVYVDDNNTSNPDVPPRYINTAIVDSGTNGRFLDKPWIAVDKPRGTGNVCTIPAGPKSIPPAQTVLSGNVYVAWATFLGSGNNPHSDVWVKTSTNCGLSWSNATKVTESVPLSQSPIVAVNPNTGDVNIVWREFGQSGSPDRILTAKSTNFGKTFTRAVEVANLGVPSTTTLTTTAFDQFTLPNTQVTDLRMARSNDYPGFCIGTDAVMHVVFSQRVQQVPEPSIHYARIMHTTSPDGKVWATPQAIDPYAGAGHQFQPSIACTGTTATAMWYDERNDNAFFLDPKQYLYVQDDFIIDPIPRYTLPVHTIDVRAAQATGAAFSPSIQVSRYPLTVDSHQNVLQAQYFPVNWPLFGGGKLPFIGDYPEISASSTFRPPIGANGVWAFNDYANETPILHTLWTDNRDILAPIDASAVNVDFAKFTAPGASCQDASLTWTRNQNLYTALLARGLYLQAEGNARRTPDLLKRAYPVVLDNLAPGSTRHVRLSFSAASGPASFDYASSLTSVIIDLAPFVATVRSVFVDKGASAAVEVIGEEVDGTGPNAGVIPTGIKSRTVIAPDPTAPLDPSPEDHSLTLEPLFLQNTQTNTATYQNPAYNISDLSLITTLLNPGVISPGVISPGVISPGVISPGVISPGVISPGVISPGVISPGVISPGVISQPLVTDTYYSVQNEGEVTTGYNLNALVDSLPTGALFQILVSKRYSAPGTASCTPSQTPSLQTFSDVTSTGAGTTSFTLDPNETALVTLRALCGSSDQPCYNPNQNLSLIVKSQAPNCDTTACQPVDVPNDTAAIIDHSPPVITITPTPAITVQGTGPTGAVVNYTATAIDGIDGAVTVSCSPASGSLFAYGTTAVTCSAVDAHSNPATKTFNIIVVDTVKPVVTVPANVTKEATSASGASFTYSASATDNADPNVTATCSVPANTMSFPVTTTFALGTTTVTCTATDFSGNVGSASFTVTVVDTTKPVLTLPGNIGAIGSSGAVVNYTASATDIVDVSVPVNCTPPSGSTFPLGTTTVNCSATDSHNNTANGSFTVTVQATYGFTGLLSPYQAPPKTYNNGSTVPLSWQWTIGGVAADSSAAQPRVTLIQLAGPKCTGAESTNSSDIFVDSATPGNSDFQYSTTTKTWKLNWQSPTRPGACFNVYIESVQTGQRDKAGQVLLK
jgi:HYR domain-containing protein